MRWTDLEDKVVGSQQHHTGQCYAHLAGFRVRLIELGTFDQIDILQIPPGMPGLVDANITTAAFDQVRTKVTRLYPGIDPVFAVVGLLALVKPGNLHGMIGNAISPSSLRS